MYIMTARSWQQLHVSCRNEIWKNCTWSEQDLKFIPTTSDILDRLMCVEILPGLPKSDDPDFSDDQPPKYIGPLPTPRCEAYVSELRHAHMEWLKIKIDQLSNNDPDLED